MEPVSQPFTSYFEDGVFAPLSQLDKRAVMLVEDAHLGQVNDIALLTGQLVITAAQDGSVVKWDNGLNQKEQLVKHFAPVRSLCAYSPSEWLSGDQHGRLTFWAQRDLVFQRTHFPSKYLNGERVKIGDQIQINCMAKVSSDLGGKFLVGMHKYLLCWRHHSTKLLSLTQVSDHDPITCMQPLIVGRVVLGVGNSIQVWKHALPHYVRESVTLCHSVVLACDLLQEGMLSVALTSGGIEVIDLAKDSSTFIVPNGHEDSVTTVSKLADNLFASGGRDAMLKLWDVRQPPLCAKSYGLLPGAVTRCIKFQENTLLSASGSPSTLQLWDIRL